MRLRLFTDIEVRLSRVRLVDDGYILTPTNVSLDTGDVFSDAFADQMT